MTQPTSRRPKPQTSSKKGAADKEKNATSKRPARPSPKRKSLPNAKLEQRVIERTARLESANAQLKDLNVQLEEEIAERKPVAEQLVQHAQDLELLSGAALRLLRLDPGEDLLAFVGQQIRSWVGDAIVVVSSYDAQKNTTTLHTFFASEPETAQLVGLLGREPAGLAFEVTPKYREMMLEGALQRVDGGLYALSFEQLPVPVCRQLEATLNVQSVYAAPFAVGDDLLGTVAILSHCAGPLPRAAMVGSFLSQAAVAVERWRAERALRENQEDLGHAQRVAQIGSWRLDVRRNDLRWSDETYRMFGIPKGTPLTYETFLETVHPDDRAAVDRAWQAALRGEPYDIEHRIVVGDVVRWVRERAELEFDPQGNLRGGFGAAQDITERKEAEQQLRRATEEWERTFDNVPDLVAIIDPEHRILRANRALAQHLGVTLEQCIGQPCYTAVHGLGCPPDFCPHMLTLTDGLTHTAEVHEPRLGGDFLVSTTPLTDEHGRLIGSIHVARDITERIQTEQRIQALNQDLEQRAAELESANEELEVAVEELRIANDDLQKEIGERRRAEAALRESEHKFSVMFEKAGFAAALSRLPDGTLVNVNEPWVKVFGYPKQEAIGKTTLELNINPDAEGRARILAQLQEKGSARDVELRLRTKAGEWRTFLTNVDLVEIGGHKYILNTAQDVTARKQAEDQVTMLNQALKRRAAQLEIANQELERLATSMAKDLRAPLVSIGHVTRVILEDFGAQLPPQAVQLFDMIRANTGEMDQLTDGLLKLVEIAQHPLEKQPVDCEHLVRAVLAELQPECEGRRVEITVGPLPDCEGDPALLKQVWSHLLANALKFTRPRELARIEVGSWKPALSGVEGLEVGSSMPEGQDESSPTSNIYFVRDNGVGFAKEYADRIFRAFQRFHHAEEYEGVGLGLAVVESIVRHHGGRVWSESEVDHGATFYFTVS
ncbi:MAG: PAS domain S-box protein [Chloroflexi bacterium]|nr:PAS domain S-box protein [Chloroflexota bacterium]